MISNKQITNHYPKWLDRNEYPFNGKYFKLSVGKMHYLDEGTGEPIVFVHGNPGFSFEYRNIIKGVVNKKRCIAPDHLGFGFSDKPFNWNYFPVQHATNLEKLINYLDISDITLVVSDWGGPIGLNYALKHPSKIKKIILLNTWMWSVENDLYYKAYSLIMGGIFGRFLTSNFNFFAKLMVKNLFADKSKLTKNIHRHFYLHLESRYSRKGCYTFPGEVIESSVWLNTLWEYNYVLSTIPITIIWGMKDIAFREKELNNWISAIDNPNVIKLENVGHFPQEEAPDVVINELLKF